MNHRLRLALAVVAPVSLAGLLTWAFGRPAIPDLDTVAGLATRGHFVAAESALAELLEANPDLAAAHLLAAQLRLDRPEPPTRAGERPDPTPAHAALAHLARISPDHSPRDAQVALYRGKARYRLAQLDAAEAEWLLALELDPTVPEAGWCLLEMYYLEGRAAEGRSLALRLHAVEPDPRDRVQVLLELLRVEAQPIAPESAVQWFEAASRQAPGDLQVDLALGLALARSGKSDRGIDLLARRAREHPDRADAWVAWLTGLDDASEVERLEGAYAELPPALAKLPRFIRFEARLAQERGDLPGAIDAYRRALVAAPTDQTVGYRLARVLRLAGDIAGAERIEADRRVLLDAGRQVRPLYEEANAIPNLGAVPRPGLYRRIADLREAMGFAAEARAWNRLILRDWPADPPSLAAIERLGP